MTDRTLLYPFNWRRVKPQCFRILPGLDQFRNWRPTTQYIAYLRCTDDDNRSYRNVCNMSFVSYSAV